MEKYFQETTLLVKNRVIMHLRKLEETIWTKNYHLIKIKKHHCFVSGR